LLSLTAKWIAEAKSEGPETISKNYLNDARRYVKIISDQIENKDHHQKEDISKIYHRLAQYSDSQYQIIMDNLPMTLDYTAKRQLSNVGELKPQVFFFFLFLRNGKIIQI